ncbi:MAG TPA: type III pantothenate kinase [Paucimonas sp.]|nr:type III pantothenate kinase [Paucimonas sp.]HJW54385.1 type III pantothenate kinase [Burkholderiaceae bacterium]
MLLLVDAGNTRIKWALADLRSPVLGHWFAGGAVIRENASGLADAWRGLAISHALLSNVAGQGIRDILENALLEALAPVRITMEWFASVVSLAGVRNGYRNPAQLGCDRFASAIGAHALFPGRPLIVATCGTATTVDAITADGFFAGGMILPGLGLMAASLAKNTAQLPQVAQHILVPQPFADNTADAIVSGCIAAQAGAIERAVAAHANRHGKVQCLLSGGAAATVAPYLSMPCEVVDNLVLLGLQAVAINYVPC